MERSTNTRTTLTTSCFQRTGAINSQLSVILFLDTSAVFTTLQDAAALNIQVHISADGDGRTTRNSDMQVLQVHIRSRAAVTLDDQLVCGTRTGNNKYARVGLASLRGGLHALGTDRHFNIAVCNIQRLGVFRDTVLLVQPCNAAAAVDAQLHQRIGAFGQCRGRQREHHARCQSSGCCALGQFLLSHLYSPFTFTARTGL